MSYGIFNSNWSYNPHLEYYVGRVATFTGKLNAYFIVQEWIIQSQSTTLSALKFVEFKTNLFEVQKRPREIFL